MVLLAPATFFLWTGFLSTIRAKVPQGEIVVAEFEPDRVASVNSYMRFLGKVPDMSKTTSCFRLRIEQNRDGMPIISYATEFYNNEYRIYIHERGIYEVRCCNGHQAPIQVDFDLKFFEWNSFCSAMDFVTKEFILVINGKVEKGRNKITPNSTNIKGGGILFLGQHQDTFGGSFDQFQSIRGDLADLILVSTVLSESEMIDYTLCKMPLLNTENIVLSFQNASEAFAIRGVTVSKSVDPGTLCVKGKTRRVILTELRIETEAEEACKLIGGTLTMPKDHEDNDELFQLTSQYTKECNWANAGIVWLGLKYDEAKNHLVDYKTKEIARYNNLWGNEHASPTEPCIAYYGVTEDNPAWYGRWEAVGCDLRKCSPCDFNEVEFLKMRGLCKGSYLDRKYYVVKENRSIIFLGNKYSAIYSFPPDYTKPNDYGHWEVRRYDMPEVRAVMKKQHKFHMPMGRNSWQMSNDECGVIASDLVLTICQLGEFSCDDGSCISQDKRCNLETDCYDKSDENDCATLILPSIYLLEISPPREAPNIPVGINTSIAINAVRSIELDNFRFVIEAIITTTWFDERVSFKNLKIVTTMNNIHSDAERKPWVPTFEFLGRDNTSCDVVTRKVSILAKRISDPLPDDDQNFREDEIFSGAKNPLVMNLKVTITVSCTFDLAEFPFDKQICKIGLFSGVIIEMVFTNLYMYYMTSTFIPTLIMLIIGGSSFYFPIEDFNDRIMVSLTSLLVEATFFSQVSASIPKTAYLKFIDLWFVFCIIDLFLVNVMLALINYLYFSNEIYRNIKFLKSASLSPMKANHILRSRKAFLTTPKRKDWAIKLDRAWQIIFPGALLLFVGVYFLIAVVHLNYN